MAHAAASYAHMGGRLLQRRRLGSTDLEVSMIGLGTVKFGRNQGVKYPAAFTLPTDNDILNLLAMAADFGINLLDTAPAYGVSEERLGQLLQDRRKDWVITTKVGEEFIDGSSHFDFSPRYVRQSLERSLKRLSTDYVDILLVHSNGDDKDIIERDDIFSTLADLKKDGKIRAYGMSTKTIAGGLLTVDRADVVMVAFNPKYTDEREVIAYAHQHHKSVFIKKAFASGHLQSFESLHPVQDALQFIFSEPGVTSVIMGTINSEHLRENIKSVLALSSTEAC